MSSQKQSKINSLLMRWRKGTIAVYDWLTAQGVYRQLADTYVNSGWLERVGRGAFKRAGDEVGWTGGVYALQSQLNLSIHPGGKTALQMQGYAQYLPLGVASGSGSAAGPIYTSISRSASTPNALVILFGQGHEKLPAWFKSFLSNIRYSMTNLFGDEKVLGLSEHKVGDYSIRISSLERAMFEVCYEVPERESFDEAGQLMEGLTTLRPNLVQELLEKCGSVKTKRLFMYFADEYNHAWIKKLDLSKVDFGSGKRSFVEGGFYSKKYQIVVPRKEKAA